jgi:hypothetical protein
MDDLIDGAELEIECDCGQVAKATVGQLRRSPTLQCPQGHSIAVDGSQFDRDLKPLDQQIKKLDQTLNFGK